MPEAHAAPTTHAGHASENLDQAWTMLQASRICMLVSRDGDQLHARPMAVQADPAHQALWFIIALSGHKDDEIERDNRVCVVVEDAEKGQFLSLSGNGEVVTDRKIIEARWTSEANDWFAGGSSDPDAGLLKVTPTGAKLWQTPPVKEVARQVH